MDDALSRTTGSVVLQVGALELLARYSMNAARATSVMSSLHEFRQRDAEQTGGKQWNWKYLRDQFDQKDLEGLYRKYDDKLKETLIYIYVSLLIFFSTIHVALVIAGTFNAEIQWMSTYLSLGMYLLRISIPLLSFWKCFYDPLKRRWFWVPIMLAFVLTADLVLTDIAITIYSSSEGVSLRPAYATMALLSVYIFLPIRNNFLAIILGVIVSAVYILVFAFFTYASDPQIEVVVACDVIYLIGVNFMGIYFRLMNEIITRRSFLDRRACVESTLRLKFVKDQEERLMSSILPEHIVSRVRQDIRNMFLDIRSQRHPHNMKSFSQLYVEEHENVSILYADVVNYTQISTTLPPMRMVELLNELFGRFDEASEEHDVLRIKFLGDCYYCVSGVPKPTAQHAKNCLDLGLEMISIIKDVREKRSLNIDMRIGVHSGRILSGLIGIRKWQFDIWSKDVTIANRMEATGRAGKVHITKQTLELVLEHAREYIIEPNFASQHDPFVVKHKLETYLVTRTPKSTGDYKPFRRASVGPNKAMTTRSRARLLELGDRLLCSMRSRVVVQEQLRRAIDHCWLEMKQLIYHCDQFFTVHTCRLLQHSLTKQRPIIFLVRSENRSSSTFRRTTSFMDENLVEYQQMLKAADAQMAKEIGDMTSGKEQVRKELKLNRFTLMYKDFNLEKSFLLQPDPLFKYYMTCCLLILLLIFLINGLSTRWLENFKWSAWVSFGFLFILLTTMQPISWFHFFWRKYKGIAEPRDPRLRRLYDLSINIIKCPKIRTGVYLLVSSALAATSIVNVVGCEEAEVQPSTETVLSNCVSSWHVTQCWSLALLLNFLFSRVFFMFKWVVAGGMTLFYLWIVWEVKSPLFYIDVTWNIGLDPRVSHTLSVVFVTITLYWIDRTTEYRNRLDHLWQIQVSEEQTEAETMLKVNNMLLENILPAHVVQVYLDLNRSIDELYYEKYDNVVVMFASLTDYKLGLEGGQQADLSDKFVLSILDEVISDFDRLLLTGTSVYKVEKIKMAGWTYMAACGLDPNRRDSFDSTSFNSFVDRRQNTPYNRAIVVTMVEFAAAMMMQLQNFNRGSFQSFEELNLRIGISNGEVAAGVVGSLKPLYDIWGDAVNMASRMDSTGESGRIQVTENTANILGECGIVTMYRGETFVKGRGYVRTYFVPLDDDFNLIKKHKEIEPNVKNHFHVNFNTLAHSISMTENIIDISCESENSTLELKNSSSENDSSDDFTENEDENSRKNSGDNKLGKVNIIAELNDNIGDVRDGKNVSADADTTETRC